MFLFLFRSEKKSLLSKHEEVVTSLNQSLTTKAESRIKLNEVRSKLEETKQSVCTWSSKYLLKSENFNWIVFISFSKTIDLEEDILIVKEQLVIDKAKGRAEKTKLLEENVIHRLKTLWVVFIYWLKSICEGEYSRSFAVATIKKWNEKSVFSSFDMSKTSFFRIMNNRW